MSNRYEGIVVHVLMDMDDYKKLWEIAARNNTTPSQAAWAILKMACDDFGCDQKPLP